MKEMSADAQQPTRNTSHGRKSEMAAGRVPPASDELGDEDLDQVVGGAKFSSVKYHWPQE